MLTSHKFFAPLVSLVTAGVRKMPVCPPLAGVADRPGVEICALYVADRLKIRLFSNLPNTYGLVTAPVIVRKFPGFTATCLNWTKVMKPDEYKTLTTDEPFFVFRIDFTRKHYHKSEFVNHL